MLRSVLWPVAILAVIHRTIVVTTNGNITDDFKPVYRAVLNFRHGWDIYNEHFDYVDPHYLYPPGGTLIMAPFGYLPFAGNTMVRWITAMMANGHRIERSTVAVPGAAMRGPKVACVQLRRPPRGESTAVTSAPYTGDRRRDQAGQ